MKHPRHRAVLWKQVGTSECLSLGGAGRQQAQLETLCKSFSHFLRWAAAMRNTGRISALYFFQRQIIEAPQVWQVTFSPGESRLSHPHHCLKPVWLPGDPEPNVFFFSFKIKVCFYKCSERHQGGPGFFPWECVFLFTESYLWSWLEKNQNIFFLFF